MFDGCQKLLYFRNFLLVFGIFLVPDNRMGSFYSVEYQFRSWNSIARISFLNRILVAFVPAPTVYLSPFACSSKTGYRSAFLPGKEGSQENIAATASIKP